MSEVDTRDINASGDLSLNALEAATGGGNTIHIGPIDISGWKDGAWYVGIGGLGVMVGDGHVYGCTPTGDGSQCHPII